MSGLYSLPAFKSHFYESHYNVPCKEEDQIRKDVIRTFTPKYSAEEKEAKMESFRNSVTQILRALVHHIPEVGYVQGMNFIAAGLLFSLRGTESIRPVDEKTCFLLFVSILKTYGLEKIYLNNMTHILELTRHFEDYIKKTEPEISQKLEMSDSSVFVFFTSVLFSLCTHVLPLELSPRIFDLFFTFGLDGLMNLLFCLIKANRSKFLSVLDPEELMTMIRDSIMPGLMLVNGGLDYLMKELSSFMRDEQIVCFALKDRSH